MNELQAHIEAENAKTREWVAVDPENRWAGEMCSDPEHWAGYDIYTIGQYEQYNMDCSYSDLHKEIYGCRPTGGHPVTREEYDHLLNELEHQNQLNAQEDREYSYADEWNAIQRADEEALAEEMAMLPNKYEQFAINAGFIA